MSDLFSQDHELPDAKPGASSPLAERMRPRTLEEFIGQEHLVGKESPLRIMLENGEMPSLILWGPPGVGKTTLARLMAHYVQASFYQLNAVSSGVKDVREVIAQAEQNTRRLRKKTVLFIDEIHRFNKAQQDALLHSVEEGTITLIGATTENPSFEVIAPLLSRSQVFVLEALDKESLNAIVNHALATDSILSKHSIELADRDLLFLLSGGDARKLLNGLENAVRLTRPEADGSIHLTKQKIQDAFQRRFTMYDKKGEQHYDIISAFIKSIRGSDPDAAVYWMARMLDGGEDPKFLARRMIILASEDIGNADPYGLTLATSCFTAIDYIGMPEARIVLAQTATYLASCPKSNASYLAIDEALSDVRNLPDLPVPLHLRNAPTSLMKDLGYKDGYQYSHDFEGHFTEQQYLPDSLKQKVYYKPSDQGREKDIRDRLNRWWKRRLRS